jgi:hypothetical protein
MKEQNVGCVYPYFIFVTWKSRSCHYYYEDWFVSRNLKAAVDGRKDTSLSAVQHTYTHTILLYLVKYAQCLELFQIEVRDVMGSICLVAE